jgi:peptidoglycan/LPS O-acetylase OafA/YrhL
MLSSAKLIPNYRPDIDGLRAIAVCAVVLFHAFPGALPGGFVGVDIFFVISGYLISGHILEALRDGRFSFLDFYGKRIRRIYPALLLVICVFLAAGALTQFSSEFAILGRDAAAGALFVSNIVFYLTANYFEADAALKPLLHLWSLGVEEQFYILMPLLLAFGWPLLRRIYVLRVILLLFLGSFTLSVLFSQGHPNAAFFLPPTRFWELLAGTLLAWYGVFGPELRTRLVQSWHSHLLASAGFTCLIYSILFFHEELVFPGWRAAVPVLGCFLIIAAGPKAWLNRAVLALPAMTYLGTISFPLYLWHWPLLVFLQLLSGDTVGSAERALIVVVAVLLASLTYHGLEKPLRFSHWAKQRQRSLAAGLFVLMLLLGGVVGLAVYRYEGIPGRFSNAGLTLGDRHDWPNDPICARQFPGADFCVSLGKGPPDIALLGDSHALHLLDGLQTLLAANTHGVLAVGAGNCPPFDGVEVQLGHKLKPCHVFFDSVLARVEGDPHIQSVVLSSYAVSAVEGDFDYGGRHYVELVEVKDKMTPQLSAAVYKSGLRRTLARLVAAGKHVVFVLDNPELDFYPAACAERPYGLGGRSPCAVSRSKVEQRLQVTRSLAREVLSNFPQVKVLDPMTRFCDENYCYAKHGKQFLYADRDHLNKNGATLLAQDIVALLPAW